MQQCELVCDDVFSIYHPKYDDKHMLKVVQHATAPALNNQEATATFLLLPN
jgi:hypothetical protein